MNQVERLAQERKDVVGDVDRLREENEDLRFQVSSDVEAIEDNKSVEMIVNCFQ